MPRKSKPGSAYPPNWREIATAVKELAGWRCVRCGAAHVNRPGYTLTVHHLNMDAADCRWFNLAPLCCKCHLQIQHKVIMDRPWVMTEHSEWFRPYASGFFAARYLALHITRDEATTFLDRLISIERVVVLEDHDASRVYLSDLRRDILDSRSVAEARAGEALLVGV